MASSSARLLIPMRIDSADLPNILKYRRAKDRILGRAGSCKNCFGVLTTPLYEGDNGSSLSPFLFDVPFSASFRPIIHE